MGHIEGGPLRPVEGVVHEGLALVMAQNRQVVHVMRDGSSFDRQPAVGTGVHPPTEVRLHLQSVDERFDPPCVGEVLDETTPLHLAGQLEHVVWVSKTSGALQIGQQLGLEACIGNPAHLGALHGVPEANARQILSRGCFVVSEPRGERPPTNLFDLNLTQSKKASKVVVCAEGLGGDGCSSTHQVVVGGVAAPPQGSEVCNCFVWTISHLHGRSRTDSFCSPKRAFR